MRMEFDERRLKQMAAVKWRLAPEEWPVKVVLLARAAEGVVSGYVTQLKCVVGRTLEEMDPRAQKRRVGEGSGCVVAWVAAGLGGSSRCEGTLSTQAGSGMTARVSILPVWEYRSGNCCARCRWAIRVVVKAWRETRNCTERKMTGADGHFGCAGNSA